MPYYSFMHKTSTAEILHDLMEQTLVNGRPISQNKLAQRTGVSQPTIQRILDNPQREPRANTLHRLAAYFGVTTDYMRGTEKEALTTRKPTDINECVLAKAIEKANELMKEGDMGTSVEQYAQLVAVIYRSLTIGSLSIKPDVE